MPVLKEEYCEECKKKRHFEYIPALTLKDSYWRCRTCYEINQLAEIEEGKIKYQKFKNGGIYGR